MNQVREDLEAAVTLARAYVKKRPFDRDARIIFEKMRQALIKLKSEAPPSIAA